MLKALISYVDDRIVDSWFNSRNIEMAVLDGQKYFTPNATL